MRTGKPTVSWTDVEEELRDLLDPTGWTTADPAPGGSHRNVWWPRIRTSPGLGGPLPAARQCDDGVDPNDWRLD
ncbi:MAG: hypothetical protein HYY06_32400 [Deltaproteobacteria bacterium]|nr:hypothetical protein [Deltaproteobacteria bacterium]